MPMFTPLTCPCCGARGVTRLSLLAGLWMQRWKVVGVIATVSTAVVGQKDHVTCGGVDLVPLIGDPWRHYISICAIVATALIAWSASTHPVEEKVQVQP